MLKSLLGLVAVWPLMAAFTTAQQVTLSVANVNTSPGSQVVVPISISGGEDVSSLQFTVHFDPELLDLSAASPFRGDALTDHLVALGRHEGRVTFVIFSASLAPFQQGEDQLVSVVFELAGNAGGDALLLEMTDEEGADEEGVFVNVVGADGRIEVSSDGNVASEGQNELVFPQVANGTFSSGTISVLTVLVNRTQATANGKLTFFKSDGSPFPVTLLDGSKDSSFDYTIAPGGSTFLATDGSGEVSAGYARIISTAPLGGVLVFATRDPDGLPLAEAGVGASLVGQRFSVPILLGEDGSNTGIAVVNVSAEEAMVTLTLKDRGGNQLEEQVISLSPGEHLPRFATELLDALAATTDFEGSIEMNSTALISVVALRTQGSLLTTFPVVALPRD